ncbi:hypothetical protein EMGBD1_24190 [Anaerolineaceae bacterium]|nr:hypothetical protein EMGBD1_24190 [Anaerolineaceae bacterium]
MFQFISVPQHDYFEAFHSIMLQSKNNMPSFILNHY